MLNTAPVAVSRLAHLYTCTNNSTVVRRRSTLGSGTYTRTHILLCWAASRPHRHAQGSRSPQAPPAKQDGRTNTHTRSDTTRPSGWVVNSCPLLRPSQQNPLCSYPSYAQRHQPSNVNNLFTTSLQQPTSSLPLFTVIFTNARMHLMPQFIVINHSPIT